MKNYYLPAEWYPQDAVLITWPHKLTDWQPFLSEVEATYIQLALSISQYQKVVIVCHDSQLKMHVIQKLAVYKINLEAIIFIIAPCDDTWARDHGPITLVNSHGEIKALNYQFNAWGDKFKASLDNLINLELFKQISLQHQNYQTLTLILEGGAIESDGNGCLMTTTACLLNKNRNAHLTQLQIETHLHNQLGIQKTLWLSHGFLAGDDTDAHIDTLARFAPNNIIVYQGCHDKNDIHYSDLNKMAAQLSTFTNKKNQPYKLIELPWPEAQYSQQGERLPATYANFLIINHAVLVPIYQIPQDQLAINIMENAFPDHKIIPIDCRVVIEQFGSLHCLTMQLPKGFLAHAC